ncbi:hypothetical protein SAMN05216428_103164 [Nitrosospira sp. Nsp11]|uniref:hypothetical protein n=1 Tax=Nitrosospira sp. Nsp11 TaxID=1855338 RepID=UPI0009219FC6|nr:hypothetical protein [Nitrosospira sp. Nsp11]SHL54606.1 hypothetical protein SAMN05216428_103164 [Nitrosospira sp. Nsp11]
MKMLMQFGTIRPSMFELRFPIDFPWGHLGSSVDFTSLFFSCCPVSAGQALYGIVADRRHTIFLFHQ